MNFKDFFFSIESVSGLNEKRRNPDQNPKRGIYELAEKYKDDPDVYISFVNDLEKTSHPPTRKKTKDYIGSPKIGINPNSIYDTPSGVYAYPLQSVYRKDEKRLSIPFAFDASIVYFLRRNKDADGIDDIKNLKSEDFKTYVDRLVDVMVDLIPNAIKKTQQHYVPIPITSHLLKLTIVKNASVGALKQTVGGKLWNITRIFSLIIGHIKQDSPIMDYAAIPNFKDPSEISSEDVILLLNAVYEYVNTEEESFPAIWNSIWRKILGVEYVADKSHSGTIHHHEPSQAVFFSTKAFEVLDVIKNDFGSATKPSNLFKLIAMHGEKSPEILDFIYYRLKITSSIIQEVQKVSKKYPYFASSDFTIDFIQEFSGALNASYQTASSAFTLLSFILNGNQKEMDNTIQRAFTYLNFRAFYHLVYILDPYLKHYSEALAFKLKQELHTNTDLNQITKPIMVENFIPREYTNSRNKDAFVYDEMMQEIVVPYVTSHFSTNVQPMFEVTSAECYPYKEKLIVCRVGFTFNPEYSERLLEYINPSLLKELEWAAIAISDLIETVLPMAKGNEILEDGLELLISKLKTTNFQTLNSKSKTPSISDILDQAIGDE